MLLITVLNVEIYILKNIYHIYHSKPWQEHSPVHRLFSLWRAKPGTEIDAGVEGVRRETDHVKGYLSMSLHFLI